MNYHDNLNNLLNAPDMNNNSSCSTNNVPHQQQQQPQPQSQQEQSLLPESIEDYDNNEGLKLDKYELMALLNSLELQQQQLAQLWLGDAHQPQFQQQYGDHLFSNIENEMTKATTQSYSPVMVPQQQQQQLRQQPAMMVHSYHHYYPQQPQQPQPQTSYSQVDSSYPQPDGGVVGGFMSQIRSIIDHKASLSQQHQQQQQQHLEQSSSVRAPSPPSLYLNYNNNTNYNHHQIMMPNHGCVPAATATTPTTEMPSLLSSSLTNNTNSYSLSFPQQQQQQQLVTHHHHYPQPYSAQFQSTIEHNSSSLSMNTPQASSTSPPLTMNHHNNNNNHLLPSSSTVGAPLSAPPSYTPQQLPQQQQQQTPNWMITRAQQRTRNHQASSDNQQPKHQGTSASQTQQPTHPVLNFVNVSPDDVASIATGSLFHTGSSSQKKRTSKRVSSPPGTLPGEGRHSPPTSRPSKARNDTSGQIIDYFQDSNEKKRKRQCVSVIADNQGNKRKIYGYNWGNKG